MEQTNTQTQKTNRKAVYTIVSRGEGKQDFWLQIGVAFVNKDGSYNVKLDALPVNGSMHIRDVSEKQS